MDKQEELENKVVVLEQELKDRQRRIEELEEVLVDIGRLINRVKQ